MDELFSQCVFVLGGSNFETEKFFNACFRDWFLKKKNCFPNKILKNLQVVAGRILNRRRQLAGF